VSFTKKIFLVGMPGSGKSTVGRLLAARLGLDFYDLDSEIELGQDRSIADIFEDGEENLFRRIESATLLRFLKRENRFVMATGGGTPCFHNGIKLMNESGVTVYLDTPIDILINRTGKKLHRPLLQSNRDSTIKKLLNDRQSCYSQAIYALDTAALSLDQKIDKIISLSTE